MKARKLVLSLVTAGIIASTASVSVSAAQSTTASLASAYGTTQCISLNALTSATASGTSISTSSSNGFSVSTGTAGITTSSIKLTWNKVSGVTGYIVEQYKDGKWVTVKKVTSASTTSHTVTGLSAGTTYNLRVKTYTTKDSKTTYGSPASLQVCTKPAAVTASTTSLTSSSIQVSWNRVAGANGYYIEQYKNGQWVRVGTVASSTTVNYVVKGLSPATQYKFRVQAYKSLAGIKYPGAYSSTVSNYTRPGTVTVKAGSVTDKSISLTWNKVNGASGYVVEQYKNNKWVTVTKITNPSTLKYSVGSLSAGNTYKFRMRAYKTVGSNTYYGTYSSTLSATTNPAKVVCLKKGSNHEGVVLEWNKVYGASGYVIENYVNGKWVVNEKITVPQQNYTIISSVIPAYNTVQLLSPDTSYMFRIRAYKTLNNKTYYGAYSDTIYQRTTPKPAANNKTYISSVNKNKITWSTVSGASGYEIQTKAGTGSWGGTTTIIGGTKNSIQNKWNITEGSRSYRVRAYFTKNGTKTYGPWSYEYKVSYAEEKSGNTTVAQISGTTYIDYEIKFVNNKLCLCINGIPIESGMRNKDTGYCELNGTGEFNTATGTTKTDLLASGTNKYNYINTSGLFNYGKMEIDFASSYMSTGKSTTVTSIINGEGTMNGVSNPIGMVLSELTINSVTNS